MSQNVNDEMDGNRTRALIGLGIAVVLAVGAWLFVTRATDSGLERLARIDRVRAGCNVLWANALNPIDSARVDATPLPDTIDPQSSSALRRCGGFRITKQKPVNPREMSGEPMPRGLR